MADKQNEKVEFKTLVVHSAEYKTLLTTKYEKRKPWKKRDENHEINFIPGTILKFFVKEGDVVKKDDPVLILMAMKMENTIYAPFDAKIKKVCVSEGDVLPKGTLLVEYEQQ